MPITNFDGPIDRQTFDLLAISATAWAGSQKAQDGMQELFEFVLPVFVVVGIGYAVTWKGLFDSRTVDDLVMFTQNIAIPCLLFRAISTLDLGSLTNAPLIVSYYIAAFACFFVGYIGSRTLFHRPPVDAVAIGFCCFFSNTILLGLPITERAYGGDALSGNFAIIAFHAPLLYLMGVTAVEIARGETSGFATKASHVLRAMFRNPFVIAILLGLIANVIALPLPGPVVISIDMISDAALPVALFGLGGILVQYRPEGDLKTIVMICGVSLMLHPAIVFCTGKILALDQNAMRSAVLTASMAPGVNAYIFANMYGAARRVSAASVLVATGASIVTVWFWLLVLP